MLHSSPAQAPEALLIILAAAKDASSSVRRAAQEALSTLVKASPAQAPEALPSIQAALKDEDYDVRQAALKAFSTLLHSSPAQAPETLPIILEAAKDKYSNTCQVALKAFSTLLEASPAQVQEALPIILEAAKYEDSDTCQVALKAFSTLLEASPAQAQEALPIILEAAKDEDSDVRQAALKALSTLLEVSLEQAPQEGFKIIQSFLKDRDSDACQVALGSLWSLIQVAPVRAQEALTIIREFFTAEDGSVSEAALGFFLQASLEQLLAHYWSKPDAILIAYIHPRLYHTPLVVGKSSQRGKQQQVSLYATAGEPERYLQPEGVVEDFLDHIQAEAGQIERRLSTSVRDDTLPKQAVIGKMLWERYYGHVGSEPSLPSNIEEIMDSPCPFWEGKKVKDTHLLVLIPSHVAGKPLTLDYLVKLIERPQEEGYETRCHSREYRDARIGSQSPDSSYWVLMTRDVLPGSRNKSYEDQCALVADHANCTGLGYEVPRALEAVVVMLLHHVRSGERLYSDNSSTYTRCQESAEGCQLMMGGFSSKGFYFNFNCNDSFRALGVAGLRKF